MGKILKFQGEIQVFLGENIGFPGELENSVSGQIPNIFCHFEM